MLTAALRVKAIKAQTNEMTEYVIYSRLASAVRVREHKEIL